MLLNIGMTVFDVIARPKREHATILVRERADIYQVDIRQVFNVRLDPVGFVSASDCWRLRMFSCMSQAVVFDDER